MESALAGHQGSIRLHQCPKAVHIVQGEDPSTERQCVHVITNGGNAKDDDDVAVDIAVESLAAQIMYSSLERLPFENIRRRYPDSQLLASTDRSRSQIY
jgi:hypothetical protein